MLAVIGGSGLYELEGLSSVRRLRVDTPWGAASDEVVCGHLSGSDVLFLPRHARNHRLPPHKINYRANVDALRRAGATHVVAVAAVGGISTDCSPRRLVVPDQLIDYSSGRESTYFDGSDQGVNHVDFTHPYDAGLRERLLDAAAKVGVPTISGGVYGCTNGPRLETAAEILRMRRDGCTIVGMTGMPEAVLARELGLPYACLALVVNPAAGLSADGGEISMEEIQLTLTLGMADVQRVIAQVCSASRSADSKSSIALG